MVERLTDELAAGPARHLGRERAEHLVALATPIARAVVDAGGFLQPNPLGLRPDTPLSTGRPAGG